MTMKMLEGRANGSEPHQRARRHKLMPKDILGKLPKLGTTDGQDATVYLKLFSPIGRMTLYVTEFDGDDTLYGYMVSPLGPDCDEWGYSSLSEMAHLLVIGGMPGVERDCYWSPKKVSEIEEICG